MACPICFATFTFESLLVFFEMLLVMLKEARKWHVTHLVLIFLPKKTLKFSGFSSSVMSFEINSPPFADQLITRTFVPAIRKCVEVVVE